MNVRSAWLCIDTKDKQQLPKVKYRMRLLIFAHKIVIRVFSHQYGVYRIDMFIERPIEYNLISTPVWTERKSPFVACDNFPIVIFRLPNIRNNVARIITSILKVGEIAAVGARTKNRYGPLFVDTFSLRTGVSECLYVCESWQLMKVFATNRMQTFRHQQFRLPTNETDSKKWEMSFWVLHRMDHLRKQYHDAVFFSICQTISTNIIGREKKRRTWTSFQKVNMKKQRALNAQPKWTTKRMQWNSKNTLQRLFCFMIH